MRTRTCFQSTRFLMDKGRQCFAGRKLQPYAWLLLRLHIPSAALITCLLPFMEVYSLNALLISASGTMGEVVNGLAALLLTCILVDVMVNDALPDGWTLEVFRRYRHLLIFFAAILLTWQMCMSAFQYGWSWLFLRYIHHIAGLVVLGFLDVFERHSSHE